MGSSFSKLNSSASDVQNNEHGADVSNSNDIEMNNISVTQEVELPSIVEMTTHKQEDGCHPSNIVVSVNEVQIKEDLPNSPAYVSAMNELKNIQETQLDQTLATAQLEVKSESPHSKQSVRRKGRRRRRKTNFCHRTAKRRKRHMKPLLINRNSIHSLSCQSMQGTVENNGWNVRGRKFKSFVFLNGKDPLVLRNCYSAIEHTEGIKLHLHDCVLVKPFKENELPYIARIAHIFENQKKEILISIYWYYRPEEAGVPGSDPYLLQEIYASRYRDHIEVTCIEDKCFVLSLNRYRKFMDRLQIESNEENLPDMDDGTGVPPNTDPEIVFLCRRFFDSNTKTLSWCD